MAKKRINITVDEKKLEELKKKAVRMGLSLSSLMEMSASAVGEKITFVEDTEANAENK